MLNRVLVMVSYPEIGRDWKLTSLALHVEVPLLFGGLIDACFTRGAICCDRVFDRGV